jgi:NADPH:quinone reductase-like Zn-dependent oxidoreductase
MKAAVIDGYGGSERLVVREVPRPAAGDGQVLVRVRAAGVNPVDWKMRAGRLRFLRRARFPLVLGFDVAGEVEAIGPEVTLFEPGDAVYGYLDNPHGGGYAEYAVGGETALAAKPAALSWEEAAALPLAGLSALQALRDKGALAAGERVLVNGAAGGLGHLAVQIAKALGARVAGVASAANLDFVRQLGAERAIDYRAVDFTAEDATYDIVFDVVANRSLRECEPVLAEDGVYVTTLPGPAFAVQAVLAAARGLFGEGRRARLVIGRPSGGGLAVLSGLVERGLLRPVVGTVLPLADVRRAHEASETGHGRGKIVLGIC